MAESKDPSPKGKGHADMEEFGSLIGVAVYEPRTDNVNPRTVYVNPKGKGKMTEEPEIMPYPRMKGGAETEASRCYGTKVVGDQPLTRAEKKRMKAGIRELKKLRVPEKNVTFYAGDDENDDMLF